MTASTDDDFMRLALAQAQLALDAGEVPVGAVVVKDGVVVASGFNACISAHDPSAHAEVQAIRAAAAQLGNYRLDGCSLYVTLEPCTMCTGAIVNARLARVVYGAQEPKTGACGSVCNVLANTAINHHTQVTAGVLAQDCMALMSGFFRERRHMSKLTAQPLRDDALRTPEQAFAHVPDYAFEPHYVSDLPALGGWRMHYVDEGPKDAPVTWLLLHGNPTWSYVWRHWITHLRSLGHRVVAPDLVGFGKSDKPKKDQAHHFDLHRDALLQLIEHLDLSHIHLAVQDWGGLLGLTLPMAAPQRFDALLAMNTTLATGDKPLGAGFEAWRQFCADKPNFSVSGLMQRACAHLTPAEAQAYDAPFPDAGHRAALRRFPAMVMDHVDAPGARISREARDFWQHAWTGRSAMAIGAADPVLGLPTMQALHAGIRQCAAPVVIEQGGHFLQEWAHPQARTHMPEGLAAWAAATLCQTTAP
jgi:tRNA(adenine34) deaminase